jgi:hypothetical protein
MDAADVSYVFGVNESDQVQMLYSSGFLWMWLLPQSEVPAGIPSFPATGKDGIPESFPGKAASKDHWL